MRKAIFIDKNSGIPLLGLIHIGIIDRGSNLLQIRPTTVCNLECVYCSTDAGVFSMKHDIDYIADVSFIIDTLKEVIAYKGDGLIVNIDSVGEPTTYPKLTELIAKIRKLPQVKEISMQTNGTLIDKEKITALEKAGLDKINLSVNALDQDLAKIISGRKDYNIQKVMENARFIAKHTKIRLWLCPVWIAGLNDEEIPKIIKFTKGIGADLGIQKYETYKYSRKPKGVKPINYWKFYKRLKEWEKEFNFKLIFSNEELGFEKRKRIGVVFEKREKTYAVAKAEGWVKGQMIGVARGRSITINNCKAEIGDKVKIIILENKNGIYIAETI